MSEELREKSLLTHKKTVVMYHFFPRFGPINGDGACEVLDFLSKKKHDKSHEVIFD